MPRDKKFSEGRRSKFREMLRKTLPGVYGQSGRELSQEELDQEVGNADEFLEFYDNDAVDAPDSTPPEEDPNQFNYD